MTKQIVPQFASPSIRAPREDARDLLSRLYREIGISAVAAALCVTVGKEEESSHQVELFSPSVRAKNDIAA